LCTRLILVIGKSWNEKEIRDNEILRNVRKVTKITEMSENSLFGGDDVPLSLCSDIEIIQCIACIYDG